MNRKGFTLVEVLAVVIIISIVLMIAGPSLIDLYKNSKLKSEALFTERLSKSIDSYIKLYSSEIIFDSNSNKEATKNGQEGVVTVYRGTITIEKIIDKKLILTDDFINPGNKEIECNKNGVIEVYKDSDFVYCHKIKKDSLSCLTQEYKESLDTEYVVDTCVWEEVK